MTGRRPSSGPRSPLTPQSARPTPSINATASASTPSPPPESPGRATGLLGMHDTLSAIASYTASQPQRAHASLTRSTVLSANQPHEPSPFEAAAGADILSTLVSLPETNEDTVSAWFNERGDVCLCGDNPLGTGPMIMARRLMKELRTFTSPSQFNAMSLAIFANTSRPLTYPREATEEGDLTTPRWESVGMYCVLAAFCYAADEDTGSYKKLSQKPENADNGVMSKMLAVGLQCEAFSERCGQVNDMLLWLLLQCFIMSTWCYGDSSYASCRTLGLLTSVVIALGYHVSCEGEGDDPDWLKEIRRRALSMIWEQDMGFATFVGRPPRLSRRYCTLELPLDIPASAVIGGPQTLEAAKQEIGPNGWDRNGAVHWATRERALLHLDSYREETLVLLLGPSVPDRAKRATDILAGLKSTWESMPQLNKYTNSDMEIRTIWSEHGSVWIGCEYLYCEFLLYKMLVGCNGSHRTELIETSHRILSLVLLEMRSRRLLASERYPLEWIMAYFAMPCASVLLLELFRQNRRPHSAVKLNRSIIVKDISALIWCCDLLTESGQANFHLCKQAQSIFSRGLDEVLNHQACRGSSGAASSSHPDVTQPYTPMTNSSAQPAAQMLLPQDPEWTAWLESFGLDMDPWMDMDFADQPSLDSAMSAA